MEVDIHPFWTLLINPGETTKIQYPDGCFLTITNACITELPSNVEHKSPVRLFAKINNISDQDNEKGGNNVLLASLVPYSAEQSQLNYVFSPINDVSLTVSGTAPVQVSGIIQPIFDDEEEEEEESNEKQDEEK